jgi:hypothetical protein
MIKQKLSRTEIVRKSYSIAASLLMSSIGTGNIEAMCTENEQLSPEDAVRVSKQIEKIAARLSRQAY